MSTDFKSSPARGTVHLGELADVKQQAARVLNIESQAVAALIDRIDDDFRRACKLCLECRGRVVVTGMGKSGHIANKIAATLASTGTPSFFVHPGEASHGDMGMITSHDVVLAVSNSGETDEILLMLPIIKRLNVPLIALTGSDQSTLARNASAHLNAAVAEEACPLNLAPTASTTATLAMGDALAVVLLESRGFTSQDFAMSHPGGALGKKLLLSVADVMRTGDAIAWVPPDVKISQALVDMSKKGLGMTVVIGAQDRLLGVFTDGDLRRVIDARLDIHEEPIGSSMIAECQSVQPQMLAVEAVSIMDRYKITALPVVDDDNRVVGALNIHDLFRAGVM